MRAVELEHIDEANQGERVRIDADRAVITLLLELARLHPDEMTDEDARVMHTISAHYAIQSVLRKAMKDQ